jgi:rhamnulokinase
MISSESTSYLAFDLGASTSRAFLGTLNGHILEMDELHRFETPVLETDGHLFWDLDVIWSELQIGLEKALEACPALRSVSVDSWAVDYVSLDTRGEPLGNPYCYRDPRTEGFMDRAFNIMSAKKIYAITGIQFLPFNTLYQMMADRHDSGSSQAIHFPIADYFNYRFSGVRAVEVSMASTTQMMDVLTRQWSATLFESFDLDPSRWPEIVHSGTCLGPLAQAPEVEVVATCSHDTGSAVAATPTAATPTAEPVENWAFISCGTWSLMGTERKFPLLSDAARNAGFTNEAGLDGTVRFLKNLTGLWVLQECLREWRESGPLDWSDLELEEKAASKTTRTAHIDLGDGRFLARGPMVNRIQSYCQEYGIRIPETREDIILAILSGIAESYARTLAELESITGVKYHRVYLFGGGSQNTQLCQHTANALDREVVAGPVEAAAMGNLLIQARTMGDLPRGASIRDIACQSSHLISYLPETSTIV